MSCIYIPHQKSFWNGNSNVLLCCHCVLSNYRPFWKFIDEIRTMNALLSATWVEHRHAGVEHRHVGVEHRHAGVEHRHVTQTEGWQSWTGGDGRPSGRGKERRRWRREGWVAAAPASVWSGQSRRRPQAGPAPPPPPHSRDGWSCRAVSVPREHPLTLCPSLTAPSRWVCGREVRGRWGGRWGREGLSSQEGCNYLTLLGSNFS